MPNALIYSAGLDGHRQTYVYVLAHLLESLGYKICVAGNLNEKTSNTFYLDRLKSNPAVTLYDTSITTGGGLKITNPEIRAIQKNCSASLTIFTEADNHLELFCSQIGDKNRRLEGRNIGIFLRPFYYYQRSSFINKLRYVRYLPVTWRSDSRLFHEYLLRRHRLLDTALCIDENFVRHHSYMQWLPDMFQEYAEGLIGEVHADERIWMDRLDAFKALNENRFRVFYFGTVQPRRGYDELLKLAIDNDACFIHCGLNNEKVNTPAIESMKKQLSGKGRLFETNQYISDPECIAHFFRSVSHLVLPYRDFFGSSGIMLQALHYGIPVLVPATGIMGHRVKVHQLGMTYRDKPGFLEDAFRKFKEVPTDNYKSAIGKYMKFQDAALLKETLLNVFKGVRITTARPE